MARKAKKIELYTIRNASKQFLATYRAYNADEAIRKFVQDMNASARYYRETTLVMAADVTAAVEPRED
jgi:hypothetical protein